MYRVHLLSTHGKISNLLITLLLRFNPNTLKCNENIFKKFRNESNFFQYLNREMFIISFLLRSQIIHCFAMKTLIQKSSQHLILGFHVTFLIPLNISHGILKIISISKRQCQKRNFIYHKIIIMYLVNPSKTFSILITLEKKINV